MRSPASHDCPGCGRPFLSAEEPERCPLCGYTFRRYAAPTLDWRRADPERPDVFVLVAKRTGEALGRIRARFVYDTRAGALGHADTFDDAADAIEKALALTRTPRRR